LKGLLAVDVDGWGVFPVGLGVSFDTADEEVLVLSAGVVVVAVGALFIRYGFIIIINKN
jgi:hypothetical protein